LAEPYFTRQPSPKEIERRIEGYTSWLEIDLDAISHNLEQVRKRVGVEVVPCVKTNAYGHGLVSVVAHMMTLGVRRFLVAKLWEAEQIRDAGLDCVVVNMDPLFSEENYEKVVRRGITQTVYQKAAADKLSAAAAKTHSIALIWVKMDTGLGRVGVKWTEAVDLIKYISKLPNVEITGLFSTMSENDELEIGRASCRERVFGFV
jgi:alanine racemase